MGLLSREEMGLPPDNVGKGWPHPEDLMFVPDPVDDEFEVLCSVVRRVFGDVTFSGTLGELMAGTIIDLPARSVELTGPELLAVMAACQERDEERDEEPEHGEGPAPLIVCPDRWADDPAGVGAWLLGRAQALDVEMITTLHDGEPAKARWRSTDGAQQELVFDESAPEWWIDTEWVLHEGSPTDG